MIDERRVYRDSTGRMVVGHRADCGCFACAECRQELRGRGEKPWPALDWRGKAIEGPEQ